MPEEIPASEKQERQKPAALADYVQGAFLGKNNVLTEAEIKRSGVHLDGSRDNTTDRLHVEGQIDGKPVYQTLARDSKGTYHLSTVYKEYGGPHVQHDITPGMDDSESEDAHALEESLFNKRLIELLLEREATQE